VLLRRLAEQFGRTTAHTLERLLENRPSP
jgi:hypothetical protein